MKEKKQEKQMKTGWKWVIGITVVLVIITFIGFGSMFFRYQMTGIRNDVSKFQSYHVNPPMHMDGQNFYFDNHKGLMPGYGFAYPMTHQRSSFFRGLFPLVLLGLLVYGAYSLGTRKSGIASSKVVETEIVAPKDDVTELTCSKCGGVVQAGWRNCPHCGKRQ